MDRHTRNRHNGKPLHSDYEIMGNSKAILKQKHSNIPVIQRDILMKQRQHL